MKKRAALVMALVMFAGACSADGENEIADPTVERSVTTEEQPVAEPAAAPQPTATTAPQPTATPTPDPLGQVVDAYLAFLNVFSDERFDNVPDFEALAQVSTVLPATKPSWQVTIDPNIEDISIDGTSATITDCHGFRRVFDDPTQPTPDNAIVWDRYETRTVEMVFADEEWKFNNQTVTGVNADGVAGTVLCVPSADRAQLEALPEAYFAAAEAAFDIGGELQLASERLEVELADDLTSLGNSEETFRYPSINSGTTIIRYRTTGAAMLSCVEWDHESGYRTSSGTRDEEASPPVGTVHSMQMGGKYINGKWLANEYLFTERDTCDNFDSLVASQSVV
ncbi:MAG: hypothetical protein ACKVKO_11670 [Acidimicrobiales bacterium]